MAFATKYRCEICDVLLKTWQIDIQFDGYGGAIIPMQGSGNPLNFNFYGDDDIWNQNVLGSKASFEVISMTDFVYEELFTSDHLQYKVLIYQGASLYWTGYILVNTFSEPYNCPPYPVTITATDGLGLLSDFKFKDLGYTQRETASKIIYDMLSLVGVTSFTEYINVYESTMNNTVDDSPLDQCGVDYFLFKENDCYEALQSILKSFSAGIRQDKGGVFTIFRFKELRDATMYGRTFTSATVKSSTTKTPAQYFNRSGHASNFRDTEGGNKLTIPAVKTLYIQQDYKFKGSIYKNHNFPIDEFVLNVGTGAYECNGWTLSAGTLSNYLSFQRVGEGDNGIILNSPADPIPPTHYIYQTLNVFATSYKVGMKFDVSGITFDYTESAGSRIYAKLINVATIGGTTRYFDGQAWVAGDTFINNVALPSIKADTFGPSLKFSTVTFDVTGIPNTGTLTLRLYAGSSSGSNVFAVAKTLEVFCVDTNGLIIEGIGYTISAAVNGSIIEKEFILGDGYGFENDHLQYAGSLNTWVGGLVTPSSKSWHTRGNTENKPLVEVIGGELGAQYVRSKQLIDIPVQETHDDDFLSLIGTLEDTLNQYSGSNRKFGICRGGFDVKNRKWDLSISEIL